jgi:hypothetical protein
MHRQPSFLLRHRPGQRRRYRALPAGRRAATSRDRQPTSSDPRAWNGNPQGARSAQRRRPPARATPLICASMSLFLIDKRRLCLDRRGRPALPGRCRRPRRGLGRARRVAAAEARVSMVEFAPWTPDPCVRSACQPSSRMAARMLEACWARS